MIPEQVYMSGILNIIKASDINMIEEFQDAYRYYQILTNGLTISSSPPNIDKLLGYIFKGTYPSFSIPFEFINSPVGSVLFAIKFGAVKKVFASKDITRIIGVTRSLLSHDLGKTLIAFKSDRPILVNESDLINYMSSKGISNEEARERIDTYLQLSLEKASDNEISKAIDAIKHKYSSFIK